MANLLIVPNHESLVQWLTALGVPIPNPTGLDALLFGTGGGGSGGGGSGGTGGIYAASATRAMPSSTSFSYETQVTVGSSYAAVMVVRSESGYADGSTLDPIIIEGRNFRNDSTTGNCAHVYMPGGRLVIFRNCTFASKNQNDMINATDNSCVRVEKCRFYCDGAQPIGTTRSRAYYAFRPRRFEFENNYLENTAGGKIEYWSSNATALDKLLCRFNRIQNICGGTGSDYRQVLQVQHVIRPNTDIGWNFNKNIPGQSRVEDSYNFGEAGGTASSQLLLHDNLIMGGYQANPVLGDYSGAAITTDAGAQGVAAELQPQYILAERNLIAGYQNAAMNIAAGHHNIYQNNKIVISGFMPDGTTKLQGIYTAVSIFRGQQYSTAQFDFNQIINNDIFTNTANGKGFFFENSLDPNVDPYKRYAGPNSKALLAGNTLNTYRDGAQYSDELKLLADFQTKLEAQQIQIGIPV